MNGPHDKPDIPWQDGWDVLIPWEAVLAERIQEHEEFLAQYKGNSGGSGGPGGTPGVSWSGTQVGTASPVSGVAAAPTTTTAVSTGGA